MNFISIQFLIFGILTIIIYWTLRDKFKASVLLIASYIFYCFWDWRFTALLAFLTVSNFFLTRKMHEVRSIQSRKSLLVFCLSQNLLVLLAFKYFNFFTDGAQRVFDFVGINLDLPTIKILLPLGLSFFVFQILITFRFFF